MSLKMGGSVGRAGVPIPQPSQSRAECLPLLSHQNNLSYSGSMLKSDNKMHRAAIKDTAAEHTNAGTLCFLMFRRAPTR